MSDRTFSFLLATAPFGVVVLVVALVAVSGGRKRPGAGLSLSLHEQAGYLGRFEKSALKKAARRRSVRRPSRAPVTRADLSAISTYLVLKRRQFKKSGFETLGSPRPGDWRAGPGRYERHQDFMVYSRTRSRESLLRPRILVLRRHGRWSVRFRRLKPILTEFMKIFFQRPVRWGKPLDGAFPKRVRGKYGPRQWVQYWTRPILRALKEDRPYNALAVLGISTEDLYPDSRWNFVFGEARLDHRVGIYSLSRLFPDFYDMDWTVETLRQGLLLAMKVLSHETGHMLGIHHCVAYACGMNGCNSLVELAKNPLPFCPVCAAKMAWRLRFNVKKRYHKLARFFAKLGYTKQAEFYAQQAWRMGGVDLSAKGSGPAADSSRARQGGGSKARQAGSGSKPNPATNSK